MPASTSLRCKALALRSVAETRTRIVNVAMKKRPAAIMTSMRDNPSRNRSRGGRSPVVKGDVWKRDSLVPEISFRQRGSKGGDEIESKDALSDATRN